MCVCVCVREDERVVLQGDKEEMERSKKGRELEYMSVPDFRHLLSGADWQQKAAWEFAVNWPQFDMPNKKKT